MKGVIRGHPRYPSEIRERTGDGLKTSLRADPKKLLPQKPQNLDSNNLISLITSISCCHPYFKTHYPPVAFKQYLSKTTIYQVWKHRPEEENGLLPLGASVVKRRPSQWADGSTGKLYRLNSHFH
ncbi:hypothetical protein TNCV_1592281 [Trichonephila clavipes]|nr:hypothetical protein TNCV_1592281 [Trichonephila clavipes]